MTAMLIGGAVGQLVIGPLSDRFGRRKPVLVGVVAARRHVAAVRDRAGDRAAHRAAHRAGLLQRVGHRRGHGDHPRPVRRLGRLAADVPAHARHRRRAAVRPVDRRGHRRAVGLARRCSSRSRCSASCCGSSSGVGCPRRCRPSGVARAGCAPRCRATGTLLRDRHFVALAILPGLGMAVLMSYVVASPFVLREGYGLSAHAVLPAVRRQRHRPGRGCPGERLPGAAGGPDPDRARGRCPSRSGSRCVLLALALTGWGGLIALLVVLWLILAHGQLRPAERLGARADPARRDRRHRGGGHRGDAGRRRRASSARCRACSAATPSRWRPSWSARPWRPCWCSRWPRPRTAATAPGPSDGRDDRPADGTGRPTGAGGARTRSGDALTRHFARRSDKSHRRDARSAP